MEIFKMRDKNIKFVELGEKRVEKALTMLRLIKNLANRSHYEYDEVQFNKIIKVLETEIQEIKSAFRAGLNKNKSFKL